MIQAPRLQFKLTDQQQLSLCVGVTVTVPDIAEVPPLAAVKLTLPLPVAPNPIVVLLLLHAYVVPLTLLLNVIAAGDALHTVWLDGVTSVITGVGFTVIVLLPVAPTQPLAVGVTVIVVVTELLVVLAAVNVPTLPLPLAPRPVVVLLLVHA